MFYFLEAFLYCVEAFPYVLKRFICLEAFPIFSQAICFIRSVSLIDLFSERCVNCLNAFVIYKRFVISSKPFPYCSKSVL